MKGVFIVEELSQLLGNIDTCEVRVEHDANALGAQCMSIVSISYSSN